MKLNNPRMMLIAGLALALDASATSTARAAGGVTSKNSMVARAQSTYSSAPAPAAVDLNPPPLSPVPAAPAPGVLQVSPQPSPNPSLDPTPLGSSAPANRPPLGLYYGEQERLDAMNNPPLRPIPAAPYSTGNAPASQPVPNASGVPAETVPGGGVPVDGSILGTPQYGMTDRFGYAPPPGTLGQTYKRRSRLIEDNKHPRVGVVEVNLPEQVDVTARGMKSKWTGKVWRLESDPLTPGIPHIFEVKASWGDGGQVQVRTIRLIMGRIVDLDF